MGKAAFLPAFANLLCHPCRPLSHRTALGSAQRQLPGVQRLEGEEDLPGTLEEDRLRAIRYAAGGGGAPHHPAPPTCTPFLTALLHKILTESPTARITIPDIKKDRWYCRPLKKGKGCGTKRVSCLGCAQCGVFLVLQAQSVATCPQVVSPNPPEPSPNTSALTQTSLL